MLRPVQALFDPTRYPDLLVGLGHPDDAAVWRLDDERALILTTDFFTPVVDDAFDYGQIAAANSLSDIYAMGGQPFLALNIAALPPQLPAEISSEILRGGAEKCQEAGVVIAGGHSVQDKEPKYGLVVLGFVHPQKILKKNGARQGDVLFITKPLGFGVTTTALKQEKAESSDVLEVVNWMKMLNRDAAKLAMGMDLNCGTDVTGFSLMGHGMEMAEASNVRLRFNYSIIPFTSGAHFYADLGTFPGGALDNKFYFGPRVEFQGRFTEEERMLLFDPQTSGGLLLAVPQNKRSEFIKQADTNGIPAWEIGEVMAGSGLEVVK